jgi:ubiquinone/menaquinone biosynthesis C-methylase UbiE
VTRVLDPEGAHLASLQRLASFDESSVLEVGCGDGRLTVGLAEQAASVFAFDPDAESVATAQSSLPPQIADRVTLRAGSAKDIEIPRTEFDLVVFSWSL